MVAACKLIVLPLVILVLLSGCAVPVAPPVIIGDDLEVESLRAAIRQSGVYLDKLAPDRVVGEAPRRVTAGELQAALRAFERLLIHWPCPACLARELAARFELVPSSADAELSEVLFTGYYQPVIAGSLTQTDEYRYPLYRKPADLIIAEQVSLTPKLRVDKIFGRVDGEHFKPYHSREEIDRGGVLRGRGLEIAWLKDPVEAFFLHIQGSGIIRLPDGGELSVGYAAQNGRPYRSIGRLLIDRGKVSKEEMSMQRLRQYLSDHPQERNEILNFNESYVFFRNNPQGPLGSLEVPLTAARSIATDARLFPKGALVWIRTAIPILDDAGGLSGWRPIARFVLNQDTGGAIRGFRRADYYFGTGDDAGALAGYMNRPGRMFFLLLKQGQENVSAKVSR